MGDRDKGDGVKVRGFSVQQNSYDGIPIIWYNLELFSLMFLETKYELEYFRYNKVIDKNYIFTPAEIKEEQRLISRLKDLYRIMVLIRIKIKNLYDKIDSFKTAIDKKCEEDPKYFISQFIVTNDPRLSRFGLPTRLPLVPYISQKELIDSLHYAYLNGTSLLIEKSRGEGGTEIVSGFNLWMWVYVENSIFSWSSRTKELVDSSDDPDTIFERIRRMVTHLPKKMKFRFGKKYDKYMRIINPNNGAIIKGGGGENALRGGRSNFVATDEAAHLQNQKKVFAAIHGNSDSDALLSTPNGRDEFFAEKERGARKIVTMGWWKNPAKNDKWQTNEINEKNSYWFKREEFENDPAILNQEIRISYDAYCEGAFIPMEWIESAVELKINKFDHTNKVAGFDVAAGGDNKPVLVLRTDNIVNSINEIRNTKTPLEGARKAAILSQNAGTYKINYDQVSYGEDINKEMSYEYPLVTWYGIRGGASEKIYDGVRAVKKFGNLRAELYWIVRQRFQKTFLYVNGETGIDESELISIPNKESLKNQLSSPRIFFDNGKIWAESKKSMRSRGLKSPDEADSLVYSFADDAKGTGSQKILNAFNYTDKNINLNFDKNVKNFAGKIFGSGFYDENLTLYVILLFKSLNNKNMKIFFCEKYQNIEIKKIKENIENQNIDVNSVIWFGNDVIMNSYNKDWDSLWHNFAKEKIRFRKTYNINENYLLTNINNMFKNNELFIHCDCKDLLDDIRYWSLETSKEKNIYGYALAFILLIAGVNNKFINIL